MTTREAIIAGKTALGIEFGSTRIKAVLIDEAHKPIAQGSHEWENRLDGKIWTYTQNDIWDGLQDCYADLAEDVKKQYDVELTTIGAIGMSAMMHGYLAFDKNDCLLVPFRTWRNTITGQAAAALSKEFDFNIPQRWSISHLYQAFLNGEDHITDVAFFTTLAGYVHWQLTGEKVLGVGDASGMFPIDENTGDYNADMIAKFDALVADKVDWKLEDILPKAVNAGEYAGKLTEEGARLLDPSGRLQAGIPMCPPEGDAGTGMTATNSVRVRTGNTSAGTSIFAMVVMDHYPQSVHEELDMVTTPDGHPVAMVHCNNCTSDINAWVNIFADFVKAAGVKMDKGELYPILFEAAMRADDDCGGIVSYNFFSGEPVAGFEEGRPLFARRPDSTFNLANFMRSNLYSALATLKIGLDILLKEEQVPLDTMYGHGGFFKTPVVGQKMAAAAMNAPVTVMETAGEGGAWGIAILAEYMIAREAGEELPDYLDKKVFAGMTGSTITPDPEAVVGFDKYLEDYKAGFAIEHAAVNSLQ